MSPSIYFLLTTFDVSMGIAQLIVIVMAVVLDLKVVLE
jgi:hypothetical protein